MTLPGPVRDRALALAAETLGALPPVEVAGPAPRRSPGSRRPSGPSWAPASLATSLDTDPVFLARVAELARARQPDLAAELDAGRVPLPPTPSTSPPSPTCSASAGWEERVAAAARTLESFSASGRGAEQEAVRLREQLDALRAQSRAALDEQRALVAEARAENAALRRASPTPGGTPRPPRPAPARPSTRRGDAAADADRRVSAAESETRRLRERLSEVEQALESARRAARQGRSAEDVRLRLLLDTLVDAANGLRRELALPPVTPGARPADGVAAELGDQEPGPGTRSARSRALLPDDPAVLDQLLALPQVHLVVDGYNVTKTGYGSLPLDAQRARLLTGLAGLAARTGAEVTCVFDGATLDQPASVAQPRGVRVLFSPAGTTADSVIRRLVRAEPPGRAVVVVSSDREVADGIAAAGARPVASVALVRRLDRGWTHSLAPAAGRTVGGVS